MGTTEEFRNLLMSNLFGESSFLGVSNIHIALFHGDVVDSFGNLIESNEISSPSYGRKEVAFQNYFSNIVDNQVRNSSEIAFSAAEESWGLISDIAIFIYENDDIEEEQVLLFYYKLPTPRQVDVGDIVRFPASSIRFSF